MLALGALVVAPAARAAERLKVRLIWVHQAQFAGLYVAQDLGLYEQAGLEVELLPGGPGLDPLQELTAGKVDFALGWLSGGMERRAQGFPLINLAQVVQRSALLLVSLRQGVVRRPGDLAGRRVGMWGGHFNLAPLALFAREDISVQVVPQNASMTPLLLRAVDAAAAMIYNEYHQLIQAGVDEDQIQVLDMAELGLNFPEDGLYTLASLWSRRPGLCRRFTQATMQGWRASMDDPDAAIAAVMRRVDEARLASNRSHQRWMLARLHELIIHGVDVKEMGRLDPKAMALVNRVLLERGLLEVQVDPVGFSVPAWRSEP